MAYGDFKNLNRRTAPDKVLRYKALNIAKDPKYIQHIQLELASMLNKLFDKKSPGNGIKNISNKELAEELHKPIIRKFDKGKVHSLFIDNILVQI